MTRILLASASPARLATLRSAGIDPLVRVSGVDEDAVLESERLSSGPLTPAQIPLILARAKATSVASLDDLADDVIVVGCDSVLELNGEMYGKPHSPQVARARVQQMRGSSGTLHTGHWLVDARSGGVLPRAQTGATSSTVVHFADDMTDAEIDDYIATGEPLEVAGSFTIDGFGGPFITGIEGDHHGVVGISLPMLRHLLQDFDVAISSLWKKAFVE